MSPRKYLTLLFAFTLLLAVACGKGKEVVDEKDLGEDDGAPQVTDTAETGGGTAPAAAPVAVADAATVTGLVKFEGAPPKMPATPMNADPACAAQHPTTPTDEEVVVGPGGELANVVIWVQNAPGGPYPPPPPALLDQKGCRYSPHVSSVQVGQTVQIKNSDPTLHNVHAMPKINSGFNIAQPVPNMVSEKKFDKPETPPFRIKCDVHGWMKSYVAVLPHPYHNVSKTDGTFTIGNLPPGNYTLVAWHEKYGQQQQAVTVGAEEQKAVAFTFKGV